MLTYIIGQVFWFGMFLTPVISFFIVRNMPVAIVIKYLLWLIIAVILAALFFLISMILFFQKSSLF